MSIQIFNQKKNINKKLFCELHVHNFFFWVFPFAFPSAHLDASLAVDNARRVAQRFYELFRNKFSKSVFSFFVQRGVSHTHTHTITKFNAPLSALKVLAEVGVVCPSVAVFLHAQEKRNPAGAGKHKYLNLINFIYQSLAAADRAIKLQLGWWDGTKKNVCEVCLSNNFASIKSKAS